MKVGSLVNLCQSNHRLGLIVDIEEILDWNGYRVDHKVLWPNGDWGWYKTSRLESVCK